MLASLNIYRRIKYRSHFDRTPLHSSYRGIGLIRRRIPEMAEGHSTDWYAVRNLLQLRHTCQAHLPTQMRQTHPNFHYHPMRACIQAISTHRYEILDLSSR